LGRHRGAGRWFDGELGQTTTRCERGPARSCRRGG
jgi:hypothetical protein